MIKNGTFMTQTSTQIDFMLFGLTFENRETQPAELNKCIKRYALNV